MKIENNASPAPEIICLGCKQNVPVDRDYCPYCHLALKSYWFEDKGMAKRAVPFSQNEQDYLFIDGEKVSLKDIARMPYAFKFKEQVTERQQKSLLPGWDTWLDKED